MLPARGAKRSDEESIGGNDELGVGLAAHAADGAGGASANRVGVT
jgi:hypothetical protein